MTDTEALCGALEIAKCHSAPYNDRCASLTCVADILRGGALTPTCDTAQGADQYDVAAVITMLCRVFDDIDPGTEDGRALSRAASAVVTVLPCFAAAIHPLKAEDVAVWETAEFGHETRRRGALMQPFIGLLDSIMCLIDQVTVVVCHILTRAPDTAEPDVVVPLYRLITGWGCAFRGKADCLQIVDQLFRALLGHGNCCEDPASAPAPASDGTVTPLCRSNLFQQTADIYQCAVSTFNTTQGRDFDEWVLTTPYWVTLLNIAAGHACAFRPGDVLGGQMPARHESGLIMLDSLARSPFADLAVTVAVSLLDSVHVWKRPVQVQSRSDPPHTPVDPLFVVKSGDPNSVEPREDWSDVCPSLECGAMITTAWLASTRPSFFDHFTNHGLNLPDFDRFMQFFTVAAMRNRRDSLVHVSSESSSPVAEFWKLREEDSSPLRLVSLWAAKHFVAKERSGEVHRPFRAVFLAFVGDKDLIACAHDPPAIVAAEIDVCLEFFDETAFPSFLFDPPCTNVVARVFTNIAPILLGHHLVDPTLLTSYWRLCSALLARTGRDRGVLVDHSPEFLCIARHAIAELEKSGSAMSDPPTSEKSVMGMLRYPWDLFDGRPYFEQQFADARHRSKSVPTHAAVLRGCVVKLFLHLWGSESYPVYSDRQRFAELLVIGLRQTHAAVAETGAPHHAHLECSQSDRSYAHTVNSCWNILDQYRARDGDQVFLPVLDTALELSTLSQHQSILAQLVEVVVSFFYAFSVDVLGPRRCAAAFELGATGGVLGSSFSKNLLVPVIRTVHIDASVPVPPIDPFLRAVNEILPTGNRDRVHYIMHLMSQVAHPGAATLEAVQPVWDSIAAPIPDDHWCWRLCAGQLLGAVPREQLRSASQAFMARFIPLQPEEDESELAMLQRITSLCAFVQLADPSVIRGSTSDIIDATEYLPTNCGADTRLGQCIIDNAMEGRGMTVDWAFVDNVMWRCRQALNLPSHVHPRAAPVDDAEDASDGESYDDDEVSEHEAWEPVTHLPALLTDTPLLLDSRRAIAALLAVAEWMHRNCATTVVVSTVQQGPVLERTVTASSDALRQLDPDAAAAAPTAAAMVVSSVVHWLVEFETSCYLTSDPLGAVLNHETQQLWDRVVGWAVDPSLNAALLTALPVPRDDILRAALRSQYPSKWAMAAAEDALAPVSHRPLSIKKRHRLYH